MKKILSEKTDIKKFRNKLEINIDLFSSEWVKLSYVHFRLFNDAAKITQSRRERDCFNSYKIINELLKELAQLFNDSDKEVNFCRNYYNLIQEQKKFNEFYTQFQQLFFYLNYQEKQLIVDLKNKINSWLRLLRSCLDHSIKETQSWYVCIVL